MEKLKRCHNKRILLVLFFIFGACHAPPKKVMGPVDGSELLKSMRGARFDFKSLRADGRADFRQGGRRVRFHASMLVAYPDRFFVEAGGFGFAATQVAVNSKTIHVYTPAKVIAYEASSNDGLKQLFGLKLSVRDWVQILLGQTPELPDQVEEIEPGSSVTNVTGIYGSEKITLAIESPSAWVKSIKYASRENLEIKFGKPMPTPYGSYPSSIQLSSTSASLSITFEHVSPNVTIPDSHFVIEIPKNVAMYPLETADIVIGVK